MKLVVPLLLFALVTALCLPSFALTREEAVQTVRNFEQDQRLDCYLYGGCRLISGFFGQTHGRQVLVRITVGTQVFSRRYEFTKAGLLTAGRLPDLDPTRNESVRLRDPITKEAAHDLTEALARRLFGDYGEVHWNWVVLQRSPDLLDLHVNQQLANGAISDRGLFATVSLGSGQVTNWIAHIYTLPEEASAIPVLSPSEASEAVSAVITALQGLPPRARDTALLLGQGTRVLPRLPLRPVDRST